MTEAEAAQRLMSAILVTFADRDDDELVPFRMFFDQLAEACGVAEYDREAVPEWETVGYLRERARAAFEALARGDTP